MAPFKVAFVILGLLAGSSHAAKFSFTGNFTDGNEVQPFNFSVVGPEATITLRTWSYSGSINAAGTVIAGGGFQPIVTVFNAANGAIIEYNAHGPGDLESILMPNLAAGNYIATLTAFNNFPVGPLLRDGFKGTDFPDFLGRDTHWALDIWDANSASIGVPYIISPIPEPETHAMFLAGLGFLGWRMRRSKK
jgi:hypothetical protein